MKEIKVR